MKSKPESITFLGEPYKIIYCDKPSDVDTYQRLSLFGQVDPWTSTIRIYDNGRSVEDIWETIIHETLHAIGWSLKLEILDKGDDADQKKHDELSVLATALTDTLFRNDLIKVGDGAEEEALGTEFPQDNIIPQARPDVENKILAF